LQSLYLATQTISLLYTSLTFVCDPFYNIKTSRPKLINQILLKCSNTIIYFVVNFMFSIQCIKVSFMKKPTNELMNYINCIFITSTCFGLFLRPSSGRRVLKSTIKSCVWRISPTTEFIKFYKFKPWTD
jgi:hypothetical protein